MTPDDKRHGTYAGYMAHRKLAEKACDPCMVAHRRKTKRAKIRLGRGVRNRVPLGQEAWEILDTKSSVAITAATGLSRSNLYGVRRAGPEKIVLRSTRDAIIAAGSSTHTPVGIQRRLQALSARGYCMAHIAAQVGAHPEPLVRMIRRNRPPVAVKSHIAEGVIRTYDALSMSQPPTGSVAKRRRTEGAWNGWAVPAAWDNIDDPSETPAAAHHPRRLNDVSIGDEYDHAVVTRILGGDYTVPATTAERRAVVARWTGSLNELERGTGWKVDRYVEKESA